MRYNIRIKWNSRVLDYGPKLGV